MNNKNIIRFSDEYYRIVAIEYEKMLFASIPYGQDIKEPHILSQRVIEYIKGLSKSIEREKRRSIITKRILTIIAAIIAFILASLSVSAVREAFYKLFFVEKNESYAIIQFQKDDNDHGISYTYYNTIEKTYEPTYIADGFLKTEEEVNPHYYTIKYTSGNLYYIYKQFTVNSYITINHQSEEEENILIGNKNVYIVNSGHFISAYWCEQGYYFYISGNIPIYELYKIIESV